MDCLGIDIGFGFVKAYDGQKIVSFRTVVSRAVTSGGFQECAPGLKKTLYMADEPANAIGYWLYGRDMLREG